MYGSARSVETEQEEGDRQADDAALSAQPEGARSLCLDSLYRQEAPRLLRSLSRRTSNRDEARDLLQEIFCRVARLGARSGFELERPQAYLSRMATNLLRDEAKRAVRHMSESHEPVDESNLRGHDQQRLLETRDMLTRVEEAMLKLRPKTREIFMAHRIDGLSYAEIAERTGLTIKGVEKQMSKAIAKIDRLLDRDHL